MKNYFISSVIINYITCFQVYVPLLWKIFNRWDQTNIPIGCLTQMRTVCRHLYLLIKLNAVFFPYSICRYFVQKLPFCQMYNSFIMHEPQQLAIKHTKTAQHLCLSSWEQFETLKSQFSGRSVHKTDTVRVSPSIQPRLDVLWLITWSGSLQPVLQRLICRSGRKRNLHHGGLSWTGRRSRLMPAELIKWIRRCLFGGWQGSIKRGESPPPCSQTQLNREPQKKKMTYEGSDAGVLWQLDFLGTCK